MASEFIPAVKASDVAAGSVVAVEIGSARIAVANIDGTYYAFDDTCTHAECSLADGDLAGNVITCLCHGAEFDVRTGEVLAPPAPAPVRVYPTRVEGGVVKIEI